MLDILSEKCSSPPIYRGASLLDKSGNYENLGVKSPEATKMSKIEAKIKIKQPQGQTLDMLLEGQ